MKEKKTFPTDVNKKKTVFDHVKHIRQDQSKDYYTSLSDDDKKSFSHFMILRALSMDDALVEDMAELYKVLDKIPSPQFYKLLIAIVPKSYRYYPWIKSKAKKYNSELTELVSKYFKVPKYQATTYVNILFRDEVGVSELVRICKSFGLEDKEVEELFEERK